MLHSVEAVISLNNCEFGTAASAATVPGPPQGDRWAEILAGPPPPECPLWQEQQLPACAVCSYLVIKPRS